MSLDCDFRIKDLFKEGQIILALGLRLSPSTCSKPGQSNSRGSSLKLTLNTLHLIMRKCSICEKGSILRGSRKKLRGNYNPISKTRKYPNLQKAIIDGKKVVACVQCIKSSTK